MTARSFFTIVLKVLGVLFIKDIFIAIPQIFTLMYTIKYGQPEDNAILIAMTLFMLLVYALVVYYLIFRTDFIIDRLKLDQGFQEDNFSFNIHRSTVLAIAIIIVGLYLITNEIPNLCRQLYFYFQQKRTRFGP